jgi:hypothetical protein
MLGRLSLPCFDTILVPHCPYLSENLLSRISQVHEAHIPVNFSAMILAYLPAFLSLHGRKLAPLCGGHPKRPRILE